MELNKGKMSIDFKKHSKPIKCQAIKDGIKCENKTFIQGLMFSKVSKFITGEKQDTILSIPVFLCTKCNTPLEEFLPDDV